MVPLKFAAHRHSLRRRVPPTENDFANPTNLNKKKEEKVAVCVTMETKFIKKSELNRESILLNV